MRLLAAAAEAGANGITQGVIWVYLPLQSLITGVIWWTVRKLGADQTVIKGMEGRLLAQAMEKIEHQHKNAMKLLDERHELTTKLLDERFRRISHDVEQGAQKNMSSIDEVTLRLDRAMDKIETASEQLGQKDSQIELRALTQIKDVQIEIAKNAVTKEDMKAHEASMRREMAELRSQVQQELRKA